MAKPGPYAVRGLLGVIIIVGAGVLLSTLPDRAAGANDVEGTFRRSVVLGGVQHRETSDAFERGEAAAFMGGVELDLRNATMRDGEATIELDVLMGGVNLRIPSTWTVEVRVQPLFGGVENKTRRPLGTPEGRLIVDGNVLFGGVEIEN